MRINGKLQVGPGPSPVFAVLCIQLAALILVSQWNVSLSLSISPNGSNKNNLAGGAPTLRNSQQIAASLLTTLSPLITTLNQNNYLEAQQSQVKQQVSQDISISEPRSSGEEHEESIPLATVNNHSRNNQQPSRPPQYVDVSALVGVSRVTRLIHDLHQKSNTRFILDCKSETRVTHLTRCHQRVATRV